MSIFVIYANIFRACVDNANKIICNINRNLHNFFVFILLILIVIGTVSSSTVVCEALVASKTSEAPKSTVVRFESVPSSEEKVGMCLSVADGVEICGMKAVIRYNSNAVVLKEMVPDEGLVEHGGVLSLAERDGEIVIVVDFCENYMGCVLGILVFEAFGRDVCFDVQVESLYFWEENELVLAELAGKEKFSVVVQDPRLESNSFNLTVKANNDKETAEIIICAVAPSRCFAAGFSVYVLELESLEPQSFSVLGVLDGSGAEEREFSQTVSLSCSGRYCVIIKPVVYFGTGSLTGQEIVVVIDKGSVVG